MNCYMIWAALCKTGKHGCAQEGGRLRQGRGRDGGEPHAGAAPNEAAIDAEFCRVLAHDATVVVREVTPDELESRTFYRGDTRTMVLDTLSVPAHRAADEGRVRGVPKQHAHVAVSGDEAA